MVLLQPALSMHGILALDALLVAQAMGKSCITVNATPSSLYTQSVTAVRILNRQPTAKLHARSAGLLLSVSCGSHLLPCCPTVQSCTSTAA